jgi:hypothetical protein
MKRNTIKKAYMGEIWDSVSRNPLSVDGGGVSFPEVSKFCSKFSLIMRPCVISTKIWVSKLEIPIFMRTKWVIARNRLLLELKLLNFSEDLTRFLK